MKAGCLLLSMVALACLGCDDDPTASLKTPEVTITARLSSVTHVRMDAVWGRLIITGTTRKLISADVDCFFLHIGNSSGEPWISNGIDPLRGDYPATNGTVSVPVYWALDNFASGTTADLAKATLEIRSRTLGSCFEFAPGKPTSG